MIRTLLALAALAIAATAAEKSAPSFADPALCPTRSEIAFISGGDIWVVPVNGGDAQILVSHPATESRPLYSPDGTKLAFISTRTGDGDIYVLTLATGELKRLTFDDGLEELDAWSRDGRWIYFHSASHDVGGNDIFRVSADGATPLEVSAERYVNEFHAAPSPDGSAVAFTARGMSSSQWWRHGHSHLDESEIWVRREGSPAKYEKLVEAGAKNGWPMWSPDGRSLYYVSDRGSAENLWVWQGGKSRPLTKFKDGRVLWPSIGYDGRTIVFERNFRIYKCDVRNGEASEVPVVLRGLPAGAGITRMPLSQFSGLELSPDGKKIAFTARGEVWAASAKDGGDAARITRTAANESQIEWAPDSRRIVYVSDRNGAHNLYLYDFSTQTEKQLTRDALNDAAARFSPDGKTVAFVRDRRELRVLDLAAGQERELVSGYIGFGAPAWSHDGKWVAYAASSDKSFRNIWVAPAAGGQPRAISFLANVYGGEPIWHPDGTWLLFSSTQRTENTQIARIDLIPRTPKFREDQFRDLFKETAQTPPPASAPKPAEPKKPEVKPVEIVFDGIRQRLMLLNVGLDANADAISPDGKWLLLNASVAGQQNLYVYSLDELAKEPPVARQLTSTAGSKSNAQFSPDSKEVYYIESGRIMAMPIESRQSRGIPVAAEMEVNFDKEKLAVFRQAWATMRDTFYDPDFHGVDWKAVRDRFEPQIAGARTPDEMRRLINLMLGELNASHMGISPPLQRAAGGGGTVGKLGLRFDRAEYEKSGKLRVSEVIALAPADIGKVKAGEYLMSVDGVAVDGKTNLDEILQYKINRRVVLQVAAAADGSGKREVVVRPVNTNTERNLAYRKWVEERRAYVARVSGGRLGYVHMRDMGTESLNRLYIDLDPENHAKEGVVVDIRNNNGGFVNAYALDVFARRPYMTMTPRSMPSSPARTMLGQRSLELPTILVTNQHSLSDAEDFTEGYRTLKLGKVVGEPTAGWIIYTGGMALLDGSMLRTPFTRITGADGKVMEMNPRPVDVAVERPIGESYTDHDIQLDVAVKELLAQIGSRK